MSGLSKHSHQKKKIMNKQISKNKTLKKWLFSICLFVRLRLAKIQRAQRSGMCRSRHKKKGIVSLLRPLRAHAEEGSKEGTNVCVIMCVCACHVLSSLIRHVCALSAALRGIT